MKGYIVFDTTWSRLVRWVGVNSHVEAALWQADPGSKARGVTLFPTKKAARDAIRYTRKLRKKYAWANNQYLIYEVRP